MKYLNNKVTTISLLVITIILYFGLSLAVKIPLNNIQHNIWKGYYILALDADTPVDSIVKDLNRIKGWEIFSEYNSLIQVFDYNDKLYIPVSDLKKFYVESDPLYDSFLKKLPLLFRGKLLSEDYHLVYIKTHSSPKNFSKEIKTIMKDYSCNWILPEVRLVHESISIIIFMFVIIILYIWHKELWPVLIFGIFPWFQFTSASGLPGVLVSIIFLFSMILIGSLLYKPFKHYLNLGVFDPVDRKKLVLSVFVMILSFIYLLVSLKTIFYISSFIIVILAHFSSIAFYVIILDYKRRIQQHRMFFPVKIKISVSTIRRSDLYCFSILILIIFLSPIIIHENHFESNIKLPVPVSIKGVSDFSQTSLQILNNHSIQSELPNLSDYISHMMYLETYLYGFEYSYPDPGLNLSVPHFSIERGKMKEKNVSIFRFTEEWYESIMDPGLTTDILSLFLSQGSPALVAYQSEFGDLLSGDYIRNHYWFSMFLVATLLLWLSNLSSLSGWYVLKEFLLRRKEQLV